ncbi:IS66 family element, transposase domain protein [Leptospira weilii str. UI 13098]|uniref:IS66 family element, transposase domain protein n=1 Tax=Leptospira weilii str. UI 13098 TaxID=1088542 RepID=M6Q876_9LEPT|nr:IS66 family element, transposase domain protein [Leptospira weilii str. UI 13098]
MKSKLKILHAGCWNHARRKFFDILKVDSNNAQWSSHEKVYTFFAKNRGKR